MFKHFKQKLIIVDKMQNEQLFDYWIYLGL